MSQKRDYSKDCHSVGDLCNLVAIDRNTFEYWRRSLDPNTTRKHFYDADIFCYLIMKRAIKNYRYTVSTLKNLDWEFVFDACKEVKNEDLAKSCFVIDDVDGLIYLRDIDHKGRDPIPIDEGELSFIAMYKIFDFLKMKRNKARVEEGSNIVCRSAFLLANKQKNIFRSNIISSTSMLCD